MSIEAHSLGWGSVNDYLLPITIYLKTNDYSLPTLKQSDLTNLSFIEWYAIFSNCMKHEMMREIVSKKKNRKQQH